jgi:hypothetical protein
MYPVLFPVVDDGYCLFSLPPLLARGRGEGVYPHIKEA